jgi:hypothetical protein
MVHQVADGVITAGVDGLLERIEHELGAQRRGDAPADDASRRSGASNQIGRAPRRRIGLRGRGPRPSPHDTDQVQFAHQAPHAAARFMQSFPARRL